MASAVGVTGLTDTDIPIDAARGVSDAQTFLSAQRRTSGINVSIVSAMELVVGCQNKKSLADTQQFLRTVSVVALDTAASQLAYTLVETFYLSHGLLIPDALIAATALQSGLTLYTKNVRHYQMIPSLAVTRPY